MPTLNVRGVKLRTQTNRRYVVVRVRPVPVTVPGSGTYVAFAHVDRRSDNLDTARTVARRADRGVGMDVVVIDTVTGEEV